MTNILTKEQAKQRIEKLKKEINYHRYLYHVLNKQEISDSALDSLKHELFKLEEKYPEFITPDSPSQRIGGEPLKEFKKVKHKIKQWSFNDAFDEEEIKKFDQRLKRELEKRGIFQKNLEYVSELKIDGLHIVLTYQKGILKTGATRGDGKIGEDVTQNLKTIESIPLKLKEEIDLIVEGEVWMSKKVFDKLNQEREKKGEVKFANPRNAAAGAIRQLDPKITSQRKLDSFIYDLSWTEKKFQLPKTQKEELRILKGLGFKTNSYWKYCQNIEEVIDFWKEWTKKEDSQEYLIDGIVIKLNQRKFQEILGYTGKAPRWAIAFKFPSEQSTTIIEDIIVQVGRTGALTPVAILKPVRVAGSSITRATLHNQDEIERLGIKIGDTVIIQKAGAVIPDIVKVLPNLRTGQEREFKMPKFCPICHSRVEKSEGEVAYYCSNRKCFAQQKQRIIHFISKQGFDIKGMGEKIVEQLMNQGLISNPASIFELKQGDLEPLERFAEKSAENLIKAIEKSKKISLEKFIYALGIRYLGEGTSMLITNHEPRITNLKELIETFQKISLEELEQIKGIGKKMAGSIYQWFRDRENIEFLVRLEKLGVQIEVKKVFSQKLNLKDKIFVLTGELEKLTREQAKEKIRSLGGRVSSSISRETDFIVVGKNPGSKFAKAKQSGIKMIKEREFLEMIE